MKSVLKMAVIGAAPLVICSAEVAGESQPSTRAAAPQPRLVAQSNEPLVIPDGTSREHPGAEVNQGNQQEMPANVHALFNYGMRG